MSEDTVVIVAPLILLLVLFIIEIPVAFALGISGAVGIWLLSSFDVTTSNLEAIPFHRASTYALTVVPMFMLVGVLASRSAMLEGVFEVAQRLTRRLPGGLGIASVTAATFLGGITGSSVADAATVGRIAIGEMSKRGYEKAYAAAIVAAAATVAILLPTSVALAVFGVVTGVSVGKLLLGGIVPGILTSLAYIAVILVMSTKGPAFGGASTVEIIDEKPLGLREYFSLLSGILLLTIVVGGLYTGTFTPTEAGAIAAFSSLILASVFMFFSASENKVRHVVIGLIESFKEAGSFTAMIFAIVVGATIFTHYLVMAGIPASVTEWVLAQSIPPSMVVAMFLLLLIPLGSLVDGLSMLLIVAPITYPTVAALGYDGVWYGILFVKLIEIGLLHPPLGLNIYVVCSLFPDLQPGRVFYRVIPFLVAELVVIALLFAFPGIVHLTQTQIVPR